jgi:hypothetical protein
MAIAPPAMIAIVDTELAIADMAFHCILSTPYPEGISQTIEAMRTGTASEETRPGGKNDLT